MDNDDDVLPVPLRTSPREHFKKWLLKINNFGPAYSEKFLDLNLDFETDLADTPSPRLRERVVEAFRRAGRDKGLLLLDAATSTYSTSSDMYTEVHRTLYWFFDVHEVLKLDSTSWVDGRPVTFRSRLQGVTVESLTTDPFTVLVHKGIASFPKIDTVWRRDLSGALDFPSRVKQGILYILNKHHEGHTMIPKEIVLRYMKKYEIPTEAIDDGDGNWLRIEDEDGTTCVVSKEMYDKVAFVCSRLCALHELRKLQGPRDVLEESLQGLDPAQRQHIIEYARRGVNCLSGGPGKGKSRVQAASTRVNPNCLIVTPTGMAQSNLRKKLDDEYIQEPARAEMQKDRTGTIARFALSERFREEVGILQDLRVDEASMMGTRQLYDLLRLAPYLDTLTLCGDAEGQLPPIDQGQPYRDAYECGLFASVKLDKNYRNGEHFHVAQSFKDLVEYGRVPPTQDGVLSHHTLPGTVDMHRSSIASVQAVLPLVDGMDAIITDTKASTTAVNNILHHKNGTDLEHGVSVRIYTEQRNEDADDTDAYEAHQGILTKTRVDIETGASEWEVKYTVDKAYQKKWCFGHQIRLSTLRRGDKVMCIKNDAGIGVVNGDRGVIVGVYGQGKNTEYEVRLNCGTLVRLGGSLLELGYAGTVCKYQGSEEDHILCIFNSTRKGFAHRNLFHTGISRYKRTVTIAAPAGVVENMAREPVPKRRTLLRLFLNRVIRGETQ